MELKDILKLENLNGIYKDNKGKEWKIVEREFNDVSLKIHSSEEDCSEYIKYIEEYYPIETLVNLTFEQVLAPENKVASINLLEEELKVLEAELTSLINAHIDGKEKMEEKRYQPLLTLRRRVWKSLKDRK